MLARLIFGILIGYLLYKFIVDLLFPVYFTTKKMRQQFRDLHHHAQQDAKGQQQDRETKPKASPAPPVGEYIDFEETR